MPFTFAHPAVVLPFRLFPRRWVSWTGLIIGSLTPDFEGFIHLGGPKVVSHSWAGMFWWDLPVGLALCFIFHLLFRDLLIDQLPGFLRRRVVQYRRFDWLGYVRKNAPVFLISLLLGIASHLLLDRLTHTDTYRYDERLGLELGWEESIVVRQWLQFGCSFLGMALLGWQIASLPARPVYFNRRFWKPFWFIVVFCMILTVFLRYQFAGYNEGVFFHALIAGMLVGVVVASGLFHAFKTRRSDAQQSR